jgi:hypothetical protein
MIADSFGHYSARTVHDHGSLPRTGQEIQTRLDYYAS